MREYESLKHVPYKQPDGYEVLDMNNIPPFCIPDYDLNDEKERKTYFKNVEKIIRKSKEYQKFTQFLREECNMSECSIYENVNNQDTFKIKIHQHHHPYTLFDISNAVFNKRFAFQESLDEELVAEEIIWLHYNLYVGMISLSETVHELVHNNYLFIPLDRVFGDYKGFTNMYLDYIPVEILDNLDGNIEKSREFNPELEEYNMHILNKNLTYVDTKDAFGVPDYEQLKGTLQERIQYLKNNNSIQQDKPLVKGLIFG